MCKYYTEKLRKANSTQEPRKFSFSENVDTEQDADVDNSVEQAFLDGVNGVVFDWNIDSVAEKGYNSERGENYVRTDEFRRLQAESKGESLGDSGRENYASNNEGLRGRLSSIFKGQLERCGINSGTNKLLRLTYDKYNTQFNIYEGVDGKLFHDVFEIARKYLKNGELVDLHGIETTENGIGYNDCYNYLSEDGLSGFSITPDGDLISVFNASGKKGFLYSIAPIVKEKAKTLDCYASERQNLQEIYQKVFGFKTASVMDYNMEYDHDNIAENHGNPQVAFMVNTDAEVETKHFTKDQYDEAKEYRDGFVKSESADSSESASFMPENESVLPDLSAADGETDENVDADIQYTDDEVVDSFDITDINDYVHVQKQVISTLKSESFFTDEGGTSTTVTNANSGMVVEVNTGSMREAFNDKNFKRVSKTLKIAKLATIRDIPALIKNGTLVDDDVENIHKPESNVKYAYIENNVLINGKPATIKIAIRKSPRKNKFWVHTIDIKNTDGSLLTRTENGSEVSYQTSVDVDSVPQDEKIVKENAEETEQEVIANFAGDILFTKSGKTLDSLLNSVEAKQKPKVIQAVVDFFRWIREKLSGNKKLTFQLQRLESKYTAMLKSAQKSAENTNSTGEGGKEYSTAAASADVLYLVQKVKSGDFKANEKIYFDDVSDELAAKIENLTGINVKGFKVAIEARQIEHILKDHGENGKTDHSMSSDEDIAKMEYVLKNPDGLSLSGKTQAYSYMKNGHNKTADTVLYDKDIGNKSYYVVQAIPDTKAKTLYVVSAFIGEKGYKKEASQLINAKSPDATAKSGSVVTSINRVAQKAQPVNSNSMQEAQEYSIFEDGGQFSFSSDKFSEYNKPITLDDIKTLRNIGRKSINEFTTDEIEVAQKWAYKFYQQLGTKSPFFRRWFGDWRAYDNTPVDHVDALKDNRGKVVNKDTGWIVQTSKKVHKETSNHRAKAEKNAVKYLPYIDDITEKAVLFDSVVSDNDNENSMFFHTLYAYTEVLGYPALLKLRVEELYYHGNSGTGTLRRNYILQNIEEELVSESNRLSRPNHSETNSSMNSISDLFKLVKNYDAEFTPKPVNEALIENGKPKVFYHGAKKSGGFTEYQ